MVRPSSILLLCALVVAAACVASADEDAGADAGVPRLQNVKVGRSILKRDITSISPNYGGNAGLTTVTISGSGLVDSTIEFENVGTCTNVAEVIGSNGGQVTCTVPVAPLLDGVVTVRVLQIINNVQQTQVGTFTFTGCGNGKLDEDRDEKCDAKYIGCNAECTGCRVGWHTTTPLSPLCLQDHIEGMPLQHLQEAEVRGYLMVAETIGAAPIERGLVTATMTASDVEYVLGQSSPCHLALQTSVVGQAANPKSTAPAHAFPIAGNGMAFNLDLHCTPRNTPIRSQLNKAVIVTVEVGARLVEGHKLGLGVLRLRYWNKPTERWLDSAASCRPTDRETSIVDSTTMMFSTCVLTRQFAVFLEVTTQVHFETFSNARGTQGPPGWRSVDLGHGEGNYLSHDDQWTYDNRGGLLLKAPLAAPVAIFDAFYFSDNNEPENVALVSNTFSTLGFVNIRVENSIYLAFDTWFVPAMGSSANIEVWNSAKATWISAYRTLVATANPAHVELDISAYVSTQLFEGVYIGLSDVAVRFRWQGNGAFWWVVDNVRVYQRVR